MGPQHFEGLAIQLFPEFVSKIDHFKSANCLIFSLVKRIINYQKEGRSLISVIVREKLIIRKLNKARNRRHTCASASVSTSVSHANLIGRGAVWPDQAKFCHLDYFLGPLVKFFLKQIAQNLGNFWAIFLNLAQFLPLCNKNTCQLEICEKWSFFLYFAQSMSIDMPK